MRGDFCATVMPPYGNGFSREYVRQESGGSKLGIRFVVLAVDDGRARCWPRCLANRGNQVLLCTIVVIDWCTIGEK